MTSGAADSRFLTGMGLSREVSPEDVAVGRSETQASRSAAAPHGGSTQTFTEALLNRTLGRRRRILVHRSYQLKCALFSVSGMAVLLALMIFILHRVNAQGSRELIEVAPFLRESLLARDRAQLLILIGGGVLLLGAVFLVEIMESHKTAGVVYNVRRRLEELRAGRYAAKVILRKHDHFPELAAGFNEALASLRARTEGELATLARLRARVSELLQEQVRGNSAGVKDIAESLRQALEDLHRRKSEILEP